ncbi:MAG: DUF2961 domain-containing protein [Tepidisphaeraceae bacterium]
MTGIVLRVLFVAAIIGAAPANGAVTLHGLLDELVDFDAPARWPEPAFTLKQASSYDRAEQSPDKPGWFANNDFSQYLRTEQHAGRTEYVMMDADGPGAIVRFWLTSPTPETACLRVYLDGSDTPTLEWPAYDLRSWSQRIGPPLVAVHANPDPHGGATLYLPVPYTRHCKVTLEKTRDDNPSRYYQIQYRTYSTGTEVTTLTADAVQDAREQIERVNRTLASPSARLASKEIALDETLKPGESKSTDLPAGSMAVRQLELSVGTDLPAIVRDAVLRQVILSASFDDERDAIAAPVGDFAGSGTGGPRLESWYRSVDGAGRSVCRWTMPYRERATFTLQNRSKHDVRVSLRASIEPWQWDARSMYFHATWQRRPSVMSVPMSDLNYVAVSGRGVLVGDVTDVFNPTAAWYGEGDEKIWIDSESFPSSAGTGMEDYYNASWAPNPVYQTPFASQPRVGVPGTAGFNCYTRTRNLDGMPFQKSLRFDFEVQTWKPADLDWTSCVYWYGSPGARVEGSPFTDAALVPLRVPAPAVVFEGAIECESMKIVRQSEGLSCVVQDLGFAKGFWSRGAHLLLHGRRVGDFVELTVPASSNECQRLAVCATRARDYGIIRFTVNGEPTGVDFDGYALEVTPAGPIALGVFKPKDGQFVLRAELVGSNPKSDGAKFFAGLDAVLLRQE